MSSFYRMTREELSNLLLKTYKAGWSGPLDLDAAFVEGVIEDELENKIEKSQEVQLEFPVFQSDIVATEDMTMMPEYTLISTGGTITTNNNVTIAENNWDIN